MKSTLHIFQGQFAIRRNHSDPWHDLSDMVHSLTMEQHTEQLDNTQYGSNTRQSIPGMTRTVFRVWLVGDFADRWILEDCMKHNHEIAVRMLPGPLGPTNPELVSEARLLKLDCDAGTVGSVMSVRAEFEVIGQTLREAIDRAVKKAAKVPEDWFAAAVQRAAEGAEE